MKVKKDRLLNYSQIENEFKNAKSQILIELENNNPELVKIKLEIAQSIKKELELKNFLKSCLYENDEEKCLVENELADLIEEREEHENGSLKKIKTTNEEIVKEKMKLEYKGLEELKQQDSAEIKHDEDRVQLLRESTVQFIQDKIVNTENSITQKSSELKNHKENSDINNIKMNVMLSEVMFLLIYLIAILLTVYVKISKKSLKQLKIDV